MELVADLHLHSKYSRAVSQQMVIPEIARWAAKKGIGLVGTGDWTHPLWLKELQTNLEEAGEGIYKLKCPMSNDQFSKGNDVRFLLSTEIASIYSQGGKLRRIHTLVFAPNFETAEKINEKLSLAGVNLMSDGRPITGLSVRQLAEIVFSVSNDCLVIPSHAWTPWFGIYGDKGGFNSLKEAFGNLEKNIYAIETGLSSDPAMNWRISELDNRSIVSFSDAHSPPKIGREATVFEISDSLRLSYEVIRQSLLGGDARYVKRSTSNDTSFDDQNQKLKPRIAYTIEFYPEEGKYHYTGHRNCKVKQSPAETKKLGEICPVCGKPLTVGVMQRVEELAGREIKSQKSKVESGAVMIYDEEKKRPPYFMLVPLMEILTEAKSYGFSEQNIINEYNLLTETFGSEFAVLLKTPLEKIAKIVGERVVEGIKKVRSGEIVVDPGYDGVFGTVKIWSRESVQGKSEEQKQMSLF